MSTGRSTAHTCVFWDVQDCPIPDGDYNPKLVYQNIKSALADKGYCGKVNMRAYGEKNKIWDDLLIDGITVIPAGDKVARVDSMMTDVLFWALENPSDYPLLFPNVMVVSKNITEDTDFLEILDLLALRDGGKPIDISQSVEDDDKLKQKELSRAAK
ncbi:PREDICTED: uncharacterized protein LOC104712459 isoform X2 [Camelina sativa]|uniref:Uncharacterized protein LOC104712459 isoform X2 n=1 Tax=Camelina sativa TaxID=90675 RepID=A0ABM0TKB6_CAMSA|nr:PREDICTED: uncharacterized protein LOC104712459 isoform X2 [Camelina sativa]